MNRTSFILMTERILPTERAFLLNALQVNKCQILDIAYWLNIDTSSLLWRAALFLLQTENNKMLCSQTWKHRGAIVLIIHSSQSQRSRAVKEGWVCQQNSNHLMAIISTNAFWITYLVKHFSYLVNIVHPNWIAFSCLLCIVLYLVPEHL